MTRAAGPSSTSVLRASATPVTAVFVAAAVAGPVAVAALGGPIPPWALVGLVATLILTVVTALLAPLVMPRPWRDGVTPLVSLLPAALLHVAADAPGADDLPIVAVAWLGLVGTRRQVVLSLVALAGLRLLLPVPAGAVVTPRDHALSVALMTVAAVVSLTVNSWARERDRHDAQLRETTDLLGQVAAATRAVRTGQAGRAELCEAVRRMARVQRALLLEPDADGVLRATVTTDARDVGLRLPTAPGTSPVADTLVDGRRRFVAEPRALPDADPAAASALGAASLLCEPVLLDGTARAVLVVGWRGRVVEPTARAGQAVTMIADELAALLHAEQLADSAHTDELTGLPNRRVWHQRAAEVLGRRPADDVVVALLDLDLFKAYNDRHGHGRGDELLAEFARRASSELRRSDVLIRWGGEEFVALLPGCALADAVTAVDRLRAAVPDGQTCSAGLAQWDGREDPARLLARADRALYRAKAEGRDRMAVDDGTGSGGTGSDDVTSTGAASTGAVTAEAATHHAGGAPSPSVPAPAAATPRRVQAPAGR
ncbi:hypothetical protein GCM10027047_34450 [Rhodococcus aerolatus]